MDGTLSLEALNALIEFALEKGLPVLDEADADEVDEAEEHGYINDGGLAKQSSHVLDIVRNHFDVKDKNEIFSVDLKSIDQKRHINFEVKGLKRELGVVFTFLFSIVMLHGKYVSLIRSNVK
jgi:hypothetical protein